jgi:AAA domain
MTVVLIAGGPAAGKSTTSRLVAQARTRSLLVDVDRIRDTMVVRGAVLPSAPWPPELVEQLHAARVATVGIARAYDAIGFDVVIDDFFDPFSLLSEYDELADLALTRVVITTSQDAAHQRNASRGGDLEYIDGAIDFYAKHAPSPADLVERGWRVLDTSDVDATQAAEQVLALL